ncbi:MAG: ATP-binding protein [Chloroflexota bacterium]
MQQLLLEGESLTVEFKSDRGPLSDDELVDAVVCMANGDGGVLLLGVEDDGQVTGLHRTHQTSPEMLAGFLASRTVPPVSVGVDFQPFSSAKSDHIVAILTIPSSSQVVATSDGRTRIRYLDSQGQPGCRPLYPNEWFSWQSGRGQVDVTAQPLRLASWEDLDPLEFVRLRRMIEEFRGDATLLQLSDLELARALGLITGEEEDIYPTFAGLLLVGREQALRQHLPAHEVAFQVLHGDDVMVNDFHHWPLLRIVERLLEAFEVRNEERELTKGLFRIGIPAYDPRAFRESVNNALVHRDYRLLGAVHVQLRSDRIIVNNPGGFVAGVRPNNLLSIGPRRRNPRLADCFKRIGLVERTGRGVNIIFRGQLRNGRRPPSYAASTEAAVSLTLYGGPADLDFVQLIVNEENELNRSLTVSELLILDYVRRERELNTHAAAELIQRPEPEARTVLETLVETGLLERRGATRSRIYLLSATVYRELGQPSAYVRTRGFDRLQMEQMIDQYVRAHGRITRSDVIELCRVSEWQASYLLRKLVEADVLTLVGMGRYAYYISAETKNN